MRRYRAHIALLVAGLLLGSIVSAPAAPVLKGGGGVSGTCATSNRLARFTSAFGLGCSLLSDDATNVTLTSGQLIVPVGSKTAPSLALSGATTTGIFDGGSGTPTISIAGTNLVRFGSNQLSYNVNTAITWSSGDPTVVGVDTGLSRVSAGVVGVGTGATGNVAGTLQAGTYQTGTRCANTGSPATCAAAPAGSVVIAAAATAVVVNTTAITANSQVFAMIDRGLGTLLSVTCDTTSDLTTGSPAITARTAATSFTIAVPVAPAANPMCLSYFIVN